MDTDVPTDPEEYALYMMYGDNWRQFAQESYFNRDRGGRYDYNLQFYNSVPYVALIKNIVDMLQEKSDFHMSMQPPEGIDDYENQYNIWAQNLEQLNAELTDYRGKIENYQFDPKDLEEHYAYLPEIGQYQPPSEPSFPPPSSNQPGAGWTGTLPAPGSDNFAPSWGSRLDSDPNMMYTMDFRDSDGDMVDDRQQRGAGQPGYAIGHFYKPDATIFGNGNTGTTKTQPYAIQPAAQQTTAAYAQMAKNNAATATTAAAAPTQEKDNSYMAPASAPVQNMARPSLPVAPALPPAKPTMSDQFISRYERAEATGSDNPKVKTVTPIVKTTTKKVKAI